MTLYSHGLVYNPPSCTAAPKNAIVYDFVCNYNFSKAIQSDMMAMSGNIYAINDSETDEQFALRYVEYTTYLGGTTQIITSKDKKHAVVCGVTFYEDTRIVICRGTVLNLFNINDWQTVLTDLDPYLINNDDLGSGTIDRGFYQAYESVKDDFGHIISNNPCNMFCGGHSAGAVFASMLCLRAKKKYGCNICGIYTFGSPRYGSASFKAKYEYEKLTYRYEHYNDPVPQVPTLYPQYIRIPIDPPLLYYIINQTEGYRSLGHIANGRASGCELVSNVAEPNYVDIATFYIFGHGCKPGICCPESHKPETYCASLPYPKLFGTVSKAVPYRAPGASWTIV